LYLNPERLQFCKQLGRTLMMNYVHAKAPGIFKIDRTVVDEHTLFGRALSDRQSDAKNGLVGLAGVHITGAEKDLEVVTKREGFDAVLVEFIGLIVNGGDKELS